MDNEALIAVRKGDLTKLKQRLDQGINIDAQDASGRTLLHHAASNSHREVVEYLLRKGADALVTTDKNNTVLHIAVSKSDDKLVNVILENVPRDKLRELLDAKTKASGTAALHLAVQQNLEQRALYMLAFGANYEITNAAGEKPVDLATSDSLRDWFRKIDAYFVPAKTVEAHLLVKRDISRPDLFNSAPIFNCRDDEGRTLLQAFALNGHAVMANSLAFSFRQLEEKPRDRAPLRATADEADEMVKRARELQDFWSRQRAPMRSPVGRPSVDVGKAGCHVLERAHEILIRYRRYHERQKSWWIDISVKVLEEVFEALDFDPKERYVGAGQEDRQTFAHAISSYIQQLLQEAAYQMEERYPIVEMINSTMVYLARDFSAVQLFYAVKDDDVSKVQQLIGSKVPTDVFDHESRTVLYYAVENGSKKMVKLLLKSGAKIACDCAARSLLYLAVSKGLHAKIVKLLLENADVEDLPKVIDHHSQDLEGTVLHAVAKLGRLDLVKTLLRFGATYSALNAEGRTPLHVSSSDEVSEFLRLVYDCFRDAKEANAELVHKLKAMPTNLFLAVAGARNRDGETLAVVAVKADAKSIAGIILRMIREAKLNKK